MLTEAYQTQRLEEAAAFYSGGDSSKDDPLGLGDIRMAENGEPPFFDLDEDDEDEEDEELSESEIQDQLGDLYDIVDPLNKKIKHLESMLMERVSARRR